MPEVYSFPEGTLHLWTGAANASGNPIAYVQNANAVPTWGWQPEPSISGVYRDHKTGLSISLNAGIAWTFDKTIMKIAESATAVHAKIMNSSVNGSAGYLMYSGRIDSLPYQGAQGGFFQYSLVAHFNIWSAF